MNLEDQYLRAVINRHRASAQKHFPHLERLLHVWAGKNLESIAIAGSHAKNTALRDSDVDLFLSLSPELPGPMSAIHTSLAAHLHQYSPQPRNVSVRILIDGAKVDLVPGRRREDSTNHTLWQVRHNTWLQTDITEQIRHVKSSGLIDEILALKIWTRQHALRFPSFVLELSVIQALSPSHQIAQSFLTLLEYLTQEFPNARLIDPANSNNIVSESLTQDQKASISAAAHQSLNANTWPEIL
jgi:predicted nucleotidyltransferase